jgi:hypothetical protein
MSALGQKRTFPRVRPMSALPPKADIEGRQFDVRFVPKADIDPNQSPCASRRDTRPSVQRWRDGFELAEPHEHMIRYAMSLAR